MTAQREFLESVPYFKGIDSDEIDSIQRMVFERTVGRGEIIQLEGKSAEALFFVASGAVKVFKTSADGKEQILSIVRPGESFNDIAVLDDGPTPTSVQAITPVTLYGIPRQKLQTIIRKYPQVALNTIRVLAEGTRQLVSLVEDLSFRHVIGRVAKILLKQAAETTGSSRRLTQQEMAALAGTVREVVARSLKALEAEGAIKLERHRIRIIDRQILENIVAESV